MKRGFKSNAEKKAIHFRQQLGLEPHAHLPARMLAAHIGVKIQIPAGIKGLESDKIQVLCRNGKSTWSALTMPLPNGNHLIIHNPTHSSARQESDLMHELSHIICEHKKSSFQSIGINALMTRDYYADQEDEANWLGGCLQIPKKGLMWAIFRQKMPPSEIATYYSASEQMVRLRINMSGLRHKVNQLFR